MIGQVILSSMGKASSRPGKSWAAYDDHAAISAAQGSFYRFIDIAIHIRGFIPDIKP